MRVKSNDGLILLLLILTGAIIGSIIGAALGDVFPILNFGKSIGVDPFLLDLSVVKLTFGFELILNVSGIIGIVLAFVLYRKL
ncbi:DUF4321 domain-containing protein [Fusibacter ferrireducens]|uniref:DUF4321 domain-containing protein n=1 Tax=Fusibacter ferrireducens TaxID=2785058 RepID=A0ABR9ZWN2_9FIRM|nr:DUF4321 domain-containing protein [Fusibacter ferrireducens]MBF4694862.1 DUF4321 domain-containing protein [Fusibacter ferrireducens]